MQTIFELDTRETIKLVEIRGRSSKSVDFASSS